MVYSMHKPRLPSIAWLLALALLSAGCGHAGASKPGEQAQRSADDEKRATRERAYYAGGDWARDNLGPRPPTSLIQILAVPDYFHQKKVRVEGYLVVEFEGTAVFFSSEDARYWRTGNGLWVAFSENTMGLSLHEIARRFDGKQVSIEGTFNRDDWGHMNGWPGTIEHISGLTVLKDWPKGKRPTQ